MSNILGQLVPSLAYSSNATSNTGQTLRGRTPLILIDGIPQSTPLRNGARDFRTIDPSVLQRVEVIKGATAVYGNGADGGVINFITLQPQTSKKFNAYSSIARTGMLAHADGTGGFRLNQHFTGKTGKIDYAVAGMYEKTGEYKDAKGGIISPIYGLGETDIVNVFSKLGINLNDKNRVEVMYNYFGSGQKSKYIQQLGKYGQTPTIGVSGDSKGEKEGTRYNHNAYVKFLSKKLFLNSTLETSVYGQKFYTVYGWSTSFENGGQSTIRSDKKGVRSTINTPWSIGSSIQNEVLYGVDFMNDVTWQELTDGRMWVPKMDMNNLAPFVQLHSTIKDHWIFKAGYRLDQVKIDIPSFTQIRTSTATGGKFINGGKLDFSASTFNLGLRHAKWELFKPFVSFTQGFSMVDIGHYVRGAKENDIARMDLEPIIANNYEAGFSSSFNKVSLNLSAFASTSKVGSTIIESNGTFIQQRAPEQIYGIEASVDVASVEDFLFGVGGVYMEGKADLNKNGNYDDPEDAYLTGRRITAPKVTTYVKYVPNNRVLVHAEWLYSGDRKRFQPKTNGTYTFGEGPVNSYGIVNLSASYKTKKDIHFFGGVENLLNKDYYNAYAQWYAMDDYYIKSNGIRFNVGIGLKW
jgi:iron complex outermembrane receptor protein